ncbi:MAG TPA: hypothetical protein VJI46_07235 [Candidatus Nanoarchaeia archaeon]|nr:hypothetical protein [Candidatus Nanoarchaeia archaeon]
MKGFLRVIREVNLVIDSIIVFDMLLNSLIFFLALYLVSVLIGLYPFYSAIPAAMFFIITTYLGFDQSKALLVEQKYPNLNEKLRTAFDNAYVENEVVDDLEEEVTDDLRNVRVSSFIDRKKTAYKTSAIVALCFVILLAAAFGIRFIDVNLLVSELPEFLTAGAGLSPESGDTPAAGAGESSDIYGKEKLAELGAEEIEINLAAMNFEVLSGASFREPPEVEFEETFPDIICADDPGGCGNEQYSEEKTPVEHAELVKNYFLNIAK